MRVFVTRRIADSALGRLASSVEIDLWDGDLPPPAEVVRDRVRGCDGLLCLLTERVDAALLAAAPSLKVVSNMAVGVDNIDVAACTARRIPVGHTPGVLTDGLVANYKLEGNPRDFGGRNFHNGHRSDLCDGQGCAGPSDKSSCRRMGA